MLASIKRFIGLALLACGLAALMTLGWSALSTTNGDAPAPNTCSWVDTAHSATQQRVHVNRTSTGGGDDYSLHRLGASIGDSQITQPPHVPLLFVHGHRGALDQGAYLAAQLEHVFRAQVTAAALAKSLGGGATAPAPVRIEVYSVSFGVGPDSEPAFSAAVLEQQAVFVNDALRTLQHLYGVSTRIQAVGLSFGGVVLRLAALANEHPRWRSPDDLGSVRSCLSTIYTLNSPHRAHPVFTEERMADVYSQMNHGWARVFSDPPSLSSLTHLALVSISGGARDQMVRGDLTRLDGIAPETHAMHAYTSALDGVDMPIDHDAIAWCAQMQSKLADAIVAVVRAELSQAANHAPPPNHMQTLRTVLQSSTPTKLQLSSRRRWRQSAVDESESTSTVALTNDEHHQLSMDPSTPIEMAVPVPRTSASLRRPVHAILAIASHDCGGHAHSHTYPPEDSGIYSLIMRTTSRALPTLHRLAVPKGAPFEFMVVLTNIPAEYLCAVLRFAAPDHRSVSLNEWIVHAPANTPDLTFEARKAGRHLRAGTDTRRNSLEHQWFDSPGVHASQVRSLLMLPRRDFPAGVEFVELLFSVPAEGAGAPLWAVLQFTPASTRTTHARASGWPSSDVQVRAAHTSVVTWPISKKAGPQSSGFRFELPKPTGNRTTPLFEPFAYSIALPGGEASWHLDYNPASGRLTGPLTHASTHVQTIHTLVFVDPNFAYTIRASSSWWPLMGRQLRVWFGTILRAMWAFIIMGLLLQVRAYQLACADSPPSEVQSTQKPLYSVLVRHSPVVILGADVYCAILSAARSAGIGKGLNTAYAPSLLLTLGYTLVGWSLVITLNFFASTAHWIVVRTATLAWERLSPHSSTGLKDAFGLNKSSRASMCWIAAFLVVLVLPWYPLPLLVAALVVFWLNRVRQDCSALRGDLACGSRSVHALADSILFLLGGVAVLRATGIFHQLRASPQWTIFATAPWTDPIAVAFCLVLLLKLTRARSVVTHARSSTHGVVGSTGVHILVLRERVIYAVGALLILTAPYLSQHHLYRTLPAAACLAIALVSHDLLHLSQLAASPSRLPATPLGVDVDDTPTLDSLLRGAPSDYGDLEADPEMQQLLSNSPPRAA